MDMKRNPSGDGWMVRYDNGTSTIFETEIEARRVMAKVDTAKAIVRAVQSLATASDFSDSLVAEYWDTGTYSDGDVESIGITAADLTSCITLLEQIDKLMTNQATSAAQYRTTLNKVRRVSA